MVYDAFLNKKHPKRKAADDIEKRGRCRLPESHYVESEN
jgi:hypothetical protein